MTRVKAIWQRIHAPVSRSRKYITSGPSPEPKNQSPSQKLAGISELILEILRYLPDVDLFRIQLVSRFFRQVVNLPDIQRRLFLYKSYWAVEKAGMSITRLEQWTPSAYRLCVPNPDIFDESKIHHACSAKGGNNHLTFRNSVLCGNPKWTLDDLRKSSHMDEFLTYPAIKKATVSFIRSKEGGFESMKIAIANEDGLRGRHLLDCIYLHTMPYGVWSLRRERSLFELRVDSDMQCEAKCFCVTRGERDVLMKGQWGTYVWMNRL